MIKNLRQQAWAITAHDIRFTNATLGAFPNAGANPIEEVLNANINISGNPLLGATSVTEFELVSGADPYFTNVNPRTEQRFWLSQDLRVFTATSGINPAPVSGAPAFPSDRFAGAYTYVQNVLAFHANCDDKNHDRDVSGVSVIALKAPPTHIGFSAFLRTWSLARIPEESGCFRLA